LEIGWITLVLLSAALHPLRDLALKGVLYPIAAYIGVAICWIFLALIHSQIEGHDLSLPDETWGLVALSALGLVIYYYGTLSALRRGDLSAYYPIVRSSPAAIVVFSFLFLNQTYYWMAILGIALVIVGSLMIQKPARGFAMDRHALILAVLAMLGSAAYTLTDSIAMQDVQPALFLFYVYIIVSGLLFALWCRENAGLAPALRATLEGWKQAPVRILLAGTISYLSYVMILFAFQKGAEATAVSAVRQVSIPISVILAAVALHETQIPKRLGWASMIALGIICIVLL
jgi:uncharacterized membrane protein